MGQQIVTKRRAMICMKKLTSIDEISNGFDKFTLKFSTTHSLSLHTSAEFDEIFNPAPVISAVTAAGICSCVRHQACQNECVCVGCGGVPCLTHKKVGTSALWHANFAGCLEEGALRAVQ